MPRFLVKAESVHAGAAVCDYFETRELDQFDIWVVTLGETSERDLGDIVNVLQVRLAGNGDVHSVNRPEDIGEIIPTVAAEIDADEIIFTYESESPGCDEHLLAVVDKTTRPILLLSVTEPV